MQMDCLLRGKRREERRGAEKENDLIALDIGKFLPEKNFFFLSSSYFLI